MTRDNSQDVIGSEGVRHSVFEEAYDATHEYMHDMGAIIASSKSVAFSTNKAMVEWLKRHKWRRLGTKVPSKVVASIPF